MFTTYEINDEFKHYNSQASQALSELFSKIDITPTELLVTPEDDINAITSDSGDIFILTEGVLSCNFSGKRIFFLEKGDVVAPSDFFFGSEAELDSEFAVRVLRYNRKHFYTLLFNNEDLHVLWENFVSMQLASMVSLLASCSREEKRVDPETRFVEAGEPIIIQETEPDEVFTMLSGSADVFVGEKRVGEVLEGEIFGAMAATTNTRRSASVIARIPCVVMVLPKQHFLSLAETHPHTLLKLVEDMSRRLVNQNHKIVELEEKLRILKSQ